jgi:uncharacterized membrane protein YbhN (UPF0104 family)
MSDVPIEPTAPAKQATADQVVRPNRLKNFWADKSPWLKPAISIVFFAIAMWLLHHEFAQFKAADVAESFRSIPRTAIITALFFTLCNYAVMIGYDYLGTRLVKHPLSLKQISIASLLYYSVSNSLGSILGGTPIRVRLYSGWECRPSKSFA